MELLQSVIGRMAGNSFLLKGWSVTLSAALFALAAKDSQPIFGLIALPPALAFWGLDAYYLRLERLFRCRYEDLQARHAKAEAIPDLFSMSVAAYVKNVERWFCTLFAGPVIGIHGIVTAAIVGGVLLLFYLKG